MASVVCFYTLNSRRFFRHAEDAYFEVAEDYQKKDRRLLSILILYLVQKCEVYSNLKGKQIKMYHQIIPRSFLWFVSLCAVLIIGIIGCGGDGDDDDDWVGTWAMETVDGQSLEQSFAEDFGEDGVAASIVTNDWTFNEDGTLDAEISIKIEATEGGSEIALTSSIKITGTYSLSGSNYTLTMEGEETGFFGDTEEDTGTWSRKGSTLTLNSDDGETIVFKKK